MIGQINGILLEKNLPEIVVDVHGIGYEIHISMHTFSQLPEINHQVKLLTQLIVREDAQLLYGFFEQQERNLFRNLIKISGVGPKLALAILSSVSPTEFARYVMDNNSTALVKLPGIGKKTAERLIIEMRDKLSGENIDITGLSDQTTLQLTGKKAAKQEAVSALIGLGYKSQEANKIVTNMDTQGLSVEEILRQALKGII